MSSFMCSPETLYVISDYMFTLTKLVALRRLGLFDKDPLSVGRYDLFVLLYNLNKAAIVERYGEGIEEMIGYQAFEGFKQARSYFSDKEELISDYRLLYKMTCFLYQCDEGNLSETPLYKFLIDQMSDLALDIVHKSKEYRDISIDEWN